MKKTVTLWMTEQKQVVEMPAVDLQMQYGLTVRPVELVREIEDPLRHEAPSAEGPVLKMPSGDATDIVGPVPTNDAPASGPDPVSGEQPRRRRGRRGGRGRRKPQQEPPSQGLPPGG
jgi:hypothetical protein